MEKFKHKKSLGQNFLKTESILDLIVKESDIKDNETLLEIGPGEGALTSRLINIASSRKNSSVVCIEKDHRLIPVLTDKYKNEIECGVLKVLEKDILEFDTSITKGWGDYKLIANIPYYITGAILEKFLEAKHKPKLIIVMVQKEVANRVVCKDGKESILSLATKFYGDSKIIKVVKPGNFNPPPKVDSAILKIITHEKYSTNKNLERVYLGIVKSGLAHKRKMLLPNLKSFDKDFDFAKVFTELKINEKSRGEDLKFETWIDLAKEYILWNTH